MKRIGLTVMIVLFLVSGTVTAQDGYEIMKRVDEGKSPSTTHALIQMLLKDRNGSVNERVMEQWSADDKSGNTHSVMVFHAPASVKNTRFLTVENSGGDDTQKIYLPAMDIVRRIAGGEGGSSFMGSEFTYDDMGTRELNDYTYEYLGKESFNGYECYKVKSVPKPQTDSNYHHTVGWVTVDEDINTVMKIEMYESSSELLKVMEIQELTKVNGYWMPGKAVMENVQNGRSTELIQKKLVLDKPVNPARFRDRYLETGRTN